MRYIPTLELSQQPINSCGEYASALGNAVGRFCSFCEKALTYELRLFHKQRGVLTPDASVASQDWSELLLVCGDCASSVIGFNPATTYLWPDDVNVRQAYLYALVDNITVTERQSDGVAPVQPPRSAVLVSVSSDAPQNVQTAAAATCRLFRLNGICFNDNLQQPAFELPAGAYMNGLDARVDQRLEAWRRGVEAADTVAKGLQRLALVGDGSYLRDLLSILEIGGRGFGYSSTWRTAAQARLDAIDTTLVPRLLTFLSGEQAPPTPGSRKRTAAALDQALDEADDNASAKRAHIETTLSQMMIDVKG